MDWLDKYTFVAEQAFASPEHAREVAEAFLDECLRAGTTTAAVYCTVHPQSVDAFFEAAVANGATARGEPGVWTQYSDRYYAAFVNDLHGNNVEAVWHAPERVADAPLRSGVP